MTQKAEKERHKLQAQAKKKTLEKRHKEVMKVIADIINNSQHDPEVKVIAEKLLTTTAETRLAWDLDVEHGY